MSESNAAFEYFSSGSFDKAIGEKASFDVLDKADFVPNALSLNVCTDLRRSESGVNNSNHVSPEQKKEDDDRSQMVNLPKLLNQLFNARVVLERLSISTRAANLRRTNSLTSDNPFSNEMVSTCNKQKPADLVRRYCSKCELTVADVSVSTMQLCSKCGTLLDFQCTRCDKLYSEYRTLHHHLNAICNRHNLDLKCPKCDYRTHVKKYMNEHKNHCLSELFHSCSQCEYRTKKRSNLYTHMLAKHKDNNMKAHGDLVAIGNISDIADGKEKDNMLTTSDKRQKSADLVRRYCSKCIITVAVVNVSTTQLCAKCGTLLDFQCTRCDKLYSVYNSLLDHLNSICNRQNLDLKCSKCDYQTHVRRYMYMHKTYCLSELFHSCSQCEYRTKKRSNLYTHMRAKHKDNNMKAHGDLVAIGSTSDIADGKEKDNMLTTSGNRQKPADLVRRYCSKCIITVAVVNASTTQLCAKCGTLLDFQCIRCDKLYSVYNSLLHHLNTICNRQNLDLKCPKCDYRTHAKSLMRSHLNYCTSGIKYSCSHCKYTTKRKSDFHRHRQIHLRDNDIKAHGDLVAIGNTSEIADGKEKDSG